MPIGLCVFTTTFLFREHRVLLLRRGATSPFAPGRWTGVGGRVEAGELDDLAAAATREIAEETGLTSGEVTDFNLRVVLTQPEAGRVTLIAFFTGRVTAARDLNGPAGDLHWLPVDSVSDLDWIPNAAHAFPIAHSSFLAGDPGVRFAVCRQTPDLRLDYWSTSPGSWDLDT